MGHEIQQVAAALGDLRAPIVLLKGAAYHALDIPAMRGRLASDLDIMVPEQSLDDAERLLVRAGWEHVQHDTYDQRYFRSWMHEIPPLRHRLRGTFVDLHHMILPPTAHFKPDPAQLFDHAVTIAGTNLKTLSKTDILIHSATHLFTQGEFDHALRDLIDIHDLLTHFGAEPCYLSHLEARARQLDLHLPTHYACRYARDLLGTNVQLRTQSTPGTAARSGFLQFAMDLLYPPALLPRGTGYPVLRKQVCEWLLFCRSHYLRMPLRLLVPHLLRKAYARWNFRASGNL